MYDEVGTFAAAAKRAGASNGVLVCDVTLGRWELGRMGIET
jgi:hypothetical protein